MCEEFRCRAEADDTSVGGFPRICSSVPDLIQPSSDVTPALPGAPIRDGEGAAYTIYRGMASKEAADDHLGSLTGWKTAEGAATRVAYREDEDEIIADIVGGLRSGLTYAGANTIRELQRKLNYVQISQAGVIESLPHKTLP